MNQVPNCPKCNSAYTYQNEHLLICPECAYEWSQVAVVEENQEEAIKDASGNVLSNGDTITVIKDLKIKGTSSVVKVGTKIKNIKLVSGDHNIDCKIEGIGAMKLKSEFVRKA